MAQAARKISIWSDKMMFTVEVMTNNQFDRAYARSFRDLLVNVKGHFRRQKPVRVMIRLLLRQSEGAGESRLVFTDGGVKVNSQVYLNMLQENVFPCLAETFENH